MKLIVSKKGTKKGISKLPVIALTILIISISLLALVAINQSASAQTITNNATSNNNLETSIKKATSLYSLGRYNEAIQYFDTALQINPNDSRALDIKNLALSKLGGVSTNTTQQVQQTQQSTPVQEQEQKQKTQLQQLSPIIPPHQDLDSFKANGKIDSDIITSSSKWDASGEWNLVVEDNEIQLFKTNMGWTNATSGHSHEFLGFESEDEIVLPPDNIVSIKGTMEVGTNGATSWEEVPATIDIGGGGKTITISLDHEETDHHFAGQPISGVVTSLTPCSDEPGPSMEVYPSCS